MNKKRHIEKITKSVLKAFEGGLKKGWYEFKDKSMTVDKWLKLSDKEKGDYRIGLTELGKKEAKESDLLFQMMNENMSEDKKLMDMLIEDVKCDDSGNVEIILTEDGKQVRKFYELSGLNFSDLLQRKLSRGMNKMFCHYVVVNDKVIRGQLRL